MNIFMEQNMTNKLPIVYRNSGKEICTCGNHIVFQKINPAEYILSDSYLDGFRKGYEQKYFDNKYFYCPVCGNFGITPSINLVDNNPKAKEIFNSNKPTIEKVLLSLYSICNDKDTLFDIYLYYDLNNNKEQAQKCRNEFIKLYFNTDDIDTKFVLLDMLRRNVDKHNFKLMVKKIMGKVNQYTSPNTEKASEIIRTQKLLLKLKNIERV